MGLFVKGSGFRNSLLLHPKASGSAFQDRAGFVGSESLGSGQDPKEECPGQLVEARAARSPGVAWSQLPGVAEGPEHHSRRGVGRKE